MAKQATKKTTNNGKPVTPPVETPPVETPPVETPPVVTPPVETPPVETPPVETPPVEMQEDVDMEHQKKALEIMQEHNLNEVFYVGGYYFSKKENALNALKTYKEDKLETFKK